MHVYLESVNKYSCISNKQLLSHECNNCCLTGMQSARYYWLFILDYLINRNYSNNPDSELITTRVYGCILLVSMLITTSAYGS